VRIADLPSTVFVVLSIFVAAARADEQATAESPTQHSAALSLRLTSERWKELKVKPGSVETSAAPVQPATAGSTAKPPQPPDLSVRQRLQRAIDVSRRLAAKGQPADKEVFHEFAPPVEARRQDAMLLPRVEDAKAYARVRPWVWRSPPPPAMVWKRAPVDLEPWPTPDDAAELRKLLADKDPAVRCLAVEALGTLRLREDEARIRGMLADLAEGPPMLEWNALRTARYLLYEDIAVGGVYRNLSWQRQTVAGSARAALRRITGQSWTEQTRDFAKQLSSDDAERRLVAALNLADLGQATRGSLVALIDALIAEARRPPALEEKAAAVQNQLVACLTGVVARYGKDVVPPVARAVAQGNRRTRDILANVLIKIGPDSRDAILVLTSLVNQGDNPELQARVIRARGNFGPAAAEAIPALERAAREGTGKIRDVAIEALRKIRQPAAAPPAPQPEAAKDPPVTSGTPARNPSQSSSSSFSVALAMISCWMFPGTMS